MFCRGKYQLEDRRHSFNRKFVGEEYNALLESLRGARGIDLTNERDDALSSSDYRVLTAIRAGKRYNVQGMLKVACMHGN
jgi:hypothetical protein